MQGKTRHGAGAAAGLVASGVLWYLLERGAQDLHRIAISDIPGPFGAPPLSASGSVMAAAALAGAAVISALLAATWRLSPVAALVPGLALTGYGLLWWFDFPGAQRLITDLPASLAAGADDLQHSGLFQVLGGALLTSAALPWRWTGRRVLFPAGRELLGVLAGVACLPALWYLIQLANPVGYAYAVFSTRLPDTPDLWLLPQLALAVVLGVLAAARSVSPIAAAIAGLPLLAVGLGLALAPTGTSQAATAFILGGQPLSIGTGQSVTLGAYLLFGGVLVVSAALPWRWRRPGQVLEAEREPATDLVPGTRAG